MKISCLPPNKSDNDNKEFLGKCKYQIKNKLNVPINLKKWGIYLSGMKIF